MKEINRVLQALAALKGQPPQTEVDIMRGLTLRRNSNHSLVARVHYSAHPERDPETHPEWKDQERRAYTSQASWDREQEIIDEAGGGELVLAWVLQKYWPKIVIEDRNWRPDWQFRVLGGFDHGRANPTALLRAYIDFSGTIIFAGEYYQPGREIWQHAQEFPKMLDFDRMENIYADPSIFHRTSQQLQRPGHAPERARSVYDLYQEQNITSLVSFRGDLSDVSFVNRLLLCWTDLDNREPLVKIVCPPELYREKPVPGLYQLGCPNLLWELMNTRRVQLTAQQLLHRNQSEAIVDRDNHARDAMKYLLMSDPEPSQKSLARRVDERLKAEIEATGIMQGMARRSRILEEELQQQGPQTTLYSGNIRHRIQEYAQRKRRWPWG